LILGNGPKAVITDLVTDFGPFFRSKSVASRRLQRQDAAMAFRFHILTTICAC
jgi:hypothetical protein